MDGEEVAPTVPAAELGKLRVRRDGGAMWVTLSHFHVAARRSDGELIERDVMVLQGREITRETGDDFRVAALKSGAAGWPVFRCRPGDKRPIPGESWPQTATVNHEALHAAWTMADGKPAAWNPAGATAGMVVVDVDAPKHARAADARAAVKASLDELCARVDLLATAGAEPFAAAVARTRRVRTPGGGLHVCFSAPPGFSVRNSAKREALGGSVDVRGDGGYVMLPGACDGNGTLYVLENDAPIQPAPDALLALLGHGGGQKPRTDRKGPDWTAETPEHVQAAAVDYLLRAPPAIEGAGGDHQTFTVACRLRDMGAAPAASLALLIEHYNPRCSPAWDHADLERKVANAASYAQNDFAADDCSAAYGYVELPAAISPDVAGVYDPWRDLIGPPFPLDTLPPLLRDWVEDRARIVGTDAAAFAMDALTVMSAAISHETALRMKRHDQWRVGPRLWTLIVGHPSTRKSPAFEAAIAPLRHVERNERMAHEARLALAKAMLDAETDAAAPKGKAPEPAAPPARRFIVNDTTVEMLAVILSQQPHGVLIFKDELAGLLGSMGKYGNGSAAYERSMWLQARDGGPYTLDRKSGSTSVENLSVSMLGGIQPERLADITKLESDGLLQRFVPVMIGQPAPDQDLPRDTDLDDRYEALLSRLAALPPQHCDLSAGGLAVRAALAEHLNALSAANDPSPAFAAFAGKLATVWGSLCLILHLAEGGGVTVPDDVAARADRIVREFIIPHGYVFYAEMGGGVSPGLQAVAAAILRHGHGTLTARDLQRGPQIARNMDKPALNRLVAPFVIGGWLEPRTGYPDNDSWQITAGLGARFGEQLARYQAAVAEVQARINGRDKAA